jgi:anti-sigma factor RsiW
MNCREFLDFLDDYLSKGLPPETLAEFENHLSNCPPCVAYMQGYQDVVRMGRRAFAPSDDPVPEDVPEGLVQAILAARPKA